MSVLLANLVARTPTIEDSSAIAELVAACDIAEHGTADSSTRDLVSRWQDYSCHLESDACAWVIVTGRKQYAGFACVWHRDHEEFSSFICVHPQYRTRGIGTLLLRMVEQRARELMSDASPGARISLRGVVSASNPQARDTGTGRIERRGHRPYWKVRHRSRCRIRSTGWSCIAL